MNKIDLAFEFASNKHCNQKRKSINVSYIVHLYEVYQILREFTNDEDLLIAGILHDTIEDTDTNLSEIVKIFGKNVAEIVDYCSEHDKSQPYLLRKYEHALHMKDAPISSKMVKCADCISNWNSTYLDLKNNIDIFSYFHAEKEIVKLNYMMSLAALGDLKEVCYPLYKRMLDLFFLIFGEENKNFDFDSSFSLARIKLDN